MMSGQSDRKPGDFQLDPFGWAKGDKAEKMMLSEVIHCRTAMLAFSGVVTQSALKEIGFPYASPAWPPPSMRLFPVKEVSRVIAALRTDRVS